MSYLIKGRSPCKSCPYRKDTPLQHWDKSEFETLLAKDKEYMGAVYGCHKKNGTVCKGWLMNQDERNLPCIQLRISLSKQNITREYLDKLKCAVPRFETVEEMCYANYPELKKEI